MQNRENEQFETELLDTWSKLYISYSVRISSEDGEQPRFFAQCIGMNLLLNIID